MNIDPIDLKEFTIDEKKTLLKKICEHLDDKVFFDFLKELDDEKYIDFVLIYIFTKDDKKKEELLNNLDEQLKKWFDNLYNLKNKTNMLNMHTREILSQENDDKDTKELELNF